MEPRRVARPLGAAAGADGEHAVRGEEERSVLLGESSMSGDAIVYVCK
jgi:hypothetical protein